MSKIQRLHRPILIALLVVGLAVLPVFVKKDNIINLALLVLLYICLASSWNILGGYTGQTNLGHAAFFGLGTITTRLLWLGGGRSCPACSWGGVWRWRLPC